MSVVDHWKRMVLAYVCIFVSFLFMVAELKTVITIDFTDHHIFRCLISILIFLDFFDHIVI